MKKITFIIAVALCLLALFACETQTKDEHVHAYGEWETVTEASCTSDGSAERSCACGDKESKIISKTGHTEEIIPAVEPTCTTEGLSEGKKCSVCDEIIKEQKTINALGHSYIYIEETDEIGNVTSFAACQRENCGDVKENPAGLYDEKGVMLASWDELVNRYGLDATDGNLKNFRLESADDILRNSSKLIIDESINKISNYALCGYAFTEIYIPKTVTYIGAGAFQCTLISEIIIPENVVEIGEYTFSECLSLKNIVVDENNQYYKSIDGNLFDKEGKVLLQYAIGKDNDEYIIPDGVVTISTLAFAYSQKIKTIVIPDSVTSIGGAAFSYSDSIKDIYYLGTKEMWASLDYMDQYMASSIFVHYDGKTEFMAAWFAHTSGSSSPRLKVLIDNDGSYLDGIQYYLVPSYENFAVAFPGNYLYYIDEQDEEKCAIAQKLLSNDEWYILKKVNATNNWSIYAVCQIDNVVYFISFLAINPDGSYKIGRINALTIK